MKPTNRTKAFAVLLEEAEFKRERARARELRESQWWKRRLAKGVCHYCGRKVAPRELTMDHVVPISRGGKTTKGNVVACCKECNTAKKQLLPMEWEYYLKRVRASAGKDGASKPHPAP
jgi:5-methylcytosine-specific restriction endonuclease McrA